MWLQHVSIIENGARLAESGLEDVLSKLFETRDLNSSEKLSPSHSMLQRFNVFSNEGDLQKMLAHSYMVQGQLQYGQSVEEGKMLQIFT